MRKLTLCLLGLSLIATPALAQMGGGTRGGGMGDGASGPSEVDNDEAPSNGIGSHDRPRDMKPVSREQFDKAVTAMFALADVNRDGMVTLAELQSVIDARRDAVIRARFQAIDSNRNGTIDLAEFIAWQHKVGSAAASECSAYTGQLELVPETLPPPLGASDHDRALASVVEPLSATMIARANTHYRSGVTLDDVLAYENARFDAADSNHDGFLVESEVEALRHPGDRHARRHDATPDD